jgi:DNA-binding transcriptional LysR family regulator
MHLRIALLAEYLPGSLILGRMASFRAAHPEIRISLGFESMAGIEEGLIAERLNFAIVDRVVDHDFIVAADCGSLHFAAVVARTFDVSRADTNVIDLGEHLPLARAWRLATSTGTDDGATLEAAFVVPNFHAAMALMAEGAGVAFLPLKMVEAGLRSGEFVELSPERRVPPRPLQLVYRRRNTRQLHEGLFIEHLLDGGPL